MTALQERVIFRNGVQQWLSLGWLTLAVATVILHYTVVPSSSMLMAGGWLLLAVLSFLASRRIATVLTPDGLIRQRLGSERIPWPDIQAFEVRQNLAGQYVLVRTVDGKERELQLQLSMNNRGAASDRFTERLGLVQQYWLTYRGPDWQPVLPQRADS